MFRVLSMRRLGILVVAVICLSCAPRISAQVAFVQCATANDNSGTVNTVTVNISPTAGNTLIAHAFSQNNQTVSTLADSGSVSFTTQAKVTNSSFSETFGYEKNIGSGIISVTLTYPTNAALRLTVCEYSGLDKNAPADAVDTVGAFTTNGSWTTGSMTPASGHNEVVVGVVIDTAFGGSPTCVAGYTRRITANGQVSWCDQIVSSTSGSYTVTGSGLNGDQLVAVGATYTAHFFAPNTGGQFVSAPMLPQVTPSVVYPSESSYPAPTHVASGGNLSAAITAAGCGTIIDLDANGSYSWSAFPTLSNTSCGCHTDPTKWVIIRSHAYAGGSARGVRLDPSTEYANLAHIVSTDMNYAFSAVDNGTSCYWFGPGLDVNENAGNFEGILSWGDQSSTNWAHDVVWDHSYAHGKPTTPLIHCIGLHGQYEGVVDSYISDCHQQGQDTQAIVSFDGPGGALIQNNFVEGAAENLMIGGSDSQQNTLESDWTFIGNHFFKPLSWRIGDPSYIGIPWVIKNLFEIKDGNRLLITRNVMENNWGGGQNGVADVFDACNQNGAQTHGTIQDVTMYYNLLRHTAGVGNIAGCGGGPISYSDHRMYFHDDLAWDVDECVWASCGGSRPWIFSGVLGAIFDPFDIWFNHETISTANQTADFLFEGTGGVDLYYGIQITNSVMNNNEVSGAIVGQAVAPGNSTVTNFTPGLKGQNNCLIGDNSNFYTFSNFSGSQFPANQAAVYVNTGVDFHVSASSICHAAASDGKDMGANIDAVNAATSGVVQVLGNPVTVTNVSPATFTHNGSTSITITGTNFLAESGLGIIIGGAGPTSAISTNSCGFAFPGQFTITAFTDTSHFTYTGGCVVVMASPVTVALNDTINVIVNSAQTSGTINRYSPGNACTSVMVTSSTTITCTTPAATGAVTTGPVSIFVSQWGVPVQSTVFGNYN